MSQCHLYAVSQEIGSYHYVPKRVILFYFIFLVYLFNCLVQLHFYDFVMLMIIWFECHEINVDFLRCFLLLPSTFWLRLIQLG